MKKVLTLFVLFVLVSSCAAIKEAHQGWLAKNCNPDSAYAAGAEDAQNNKEFNSNPFSACSENVGSIKKGYTSGYSSVKNGVGNVLRTLVEGSYYKCELRPFTKTYSSSGSNLRGAKYEVIKKCELENSEIHCDDPECEQI